MFRWLGWRSPKRRCESGANRHCLPWSYGSLVEPRHQTDMAAMGVHLWSQPFWFYATWKAEQWGIFALCFFYTYSWARGLRQWLPKKTSNE